MGMKEKIVRNGGEDSARWEENREQNGAQETVE